MRALSTSASAIAALTGGTVAGELRRVSGVAAVEDAGPDDLAYFTKGDPGHAGVLLARAPIEGRTVIVVPDPLAAMCVLLDHFLPEPPFVGAVHPTAKVDPTAVLDPGVVVGADCVIGPGTHLFPNVVVYARTTIGARCRVHAGTVLGADGFRYHPTAAGPLKVPQVGGVQLGDDVEIGASSAVDRGFLSDTTLGDGCKIDNLVQIGHNCRLGRFVIIAGQAGVSGSSVIGDGVLIAGQVGIADHSNVGPGAKIGAQAGVRGNIPAGESWVGSPAMPIGQTSRIFAAMKDLPAMWKAWQK